MNELIEVFQQYLDMDNETRQSIAQEATTNIFNHLEEFYDEDTVYDTYLLLVSVFCCVDGTINFEEYELFTAITGTSISYDEFYEVVKNGADLEAMEELFGFVHSQGDDFVGEVMVLAICFFTADGTFADVEQAFFDEYFA